MSLNRVLAVGKETYIRAYPNPGVGICLGSKRLAISVRGGLEIFRARETKHGRIWKRTWSLLSRVKRPGE